MTNVKYPYETELKNSKNLESRMPLESTQALRDLIEVESCERDLLLGARRFIRKAAKYELLKDTISDDPTRVSELEALLIAMGKTLAGVTTSVNGWVTLAVAIQSFLDEE